MKIGIDARLLERPMTGIGRYLANIMKYLPADDPENEYVLLSYDKLPAWERANVKSIATVRNAAPRGWRQKIYSAFWMQFVVPRYIKSEKIDIFFSPNTLLPFRHTGAKNVITVHDVFHIIDRRFHSAIYNWYISFSLKRTLARADLILSVSESTKSDLMRLLGVVPEKIVVTRLAADPRFAPHDLSAEEKASLRKKYDLPDRFVLYLGVLEYRKNIDMIIAIADKLRDTDGITFVLAGKPGRGGAQYLKEIGRRPNMHYAGFLEEKDIPSIYNLAEVFLFPTHYEGFGSPPLEAMQSGIPVIASNNSSLPEVLGDSAMLFSCDDVDAFAGAIKELLNDPTKREALIKRGLAQTKTMSFEKTAHETVEALRRLR